MEDLCRRFPVVAQNVFANLDDKSLTDCKVVSKVPRDFLDNERFFWIRIIKKNFVNQNKFFKEWKTAFSRTPIAILKQMASAVGQICRQQCNLSISYLSPLHITARYGNFTLFGYIFDKMIEKSPKGFYELTPLHIAAMYGHFEVCKLIIDITISNENPRDDVGMTPLHYAAQKGHLEIYKLLAGKFPNKNPASKAGDTPLHYSAYAGHLEICKFIMDHLADKNPDGENGITPFHLAAKKGYLKLCRLFLQNIHNRYPQDSNGKTPYEYAKKKGYSKVCQLIKSYHTSHEPTLKSSS